MTRFLRDFGAACLGMALASAPLLGQQKAPSPDTGADTGFPAALRRFYFGIRVEDFPLRLFNTTTAQSSTQQPIADYTYSGSSSSQKAAPAATFEYTINPRLSVGVEFYLTHVKFIQTTQVRTGLPSPNSSTDDRPVTTYVESSTADYWVLPFLVRYNGLRSRGFLRHLYGVAGAEYRRVGRVRTGTDIYYPDGGAGYTEIPAIPTHSNQMGGVVGLGLRFVDDLGLKVAPEVRFIRWDSATFEGPSYVSARSQAEISLGFAF
ncbi:MAG TPA: hypothetical protein VKV74_15780 [Bryobacteraceae bacterium]|nr:hypothetical protein [Bryobacteraceae bacterium]